MTIKWLGAILGLCWGLGVVPVAASNGYVVENFGSRIEIKQDTSLAIKETIEVNFQEAKHGIFRIIPYIYSAKGKTITTKISIVSVTDGAGNEQTWEVENVGRSKKIKIGDADKLVTGKKRYEVNYRVTKVLQDYSEGTELYWNVTGAEWDAPIERAEVEVISEWAAIQNSDCLAGVTGTKDKKCEFNQEEKVMRASSLEPYGWGEDLTVVVGLSKDNQLIWPSKLSQAVEKVADNWGYMVAIIPVLTAIWLWYTRGRDKRYLTANVYYRPEENQERVVGVTERPHLPLVYGPIEGLTPAGLGAIIDERVDTKDVVAEIVELARIKEIKIEKIEKKGFLGIKGRDYQLTDIGNGDNLVEYQKYLKNSLFGKITKSGGERSIKVSELKNEFYVHLEPFRKKVYQEMVKIKAMETDPRAVVGKYGVLMGVINLAMLVAVGKFSSITGNGGPMVIAWIQAVVSMGIMVFMPRKTAWGYSLHRQGVGLEHYLRLGKWREEIAEKHLFVDEVLPLAIALGVVDKLAKDMEGLAMEPPEYFQGVTTGTFLRDISGFRAMAGTNLTTAPIKYSGSGSWSGGSGFSGGSSGGGFGGGGGGSW